MSNEALEDFLANYDQNVAKLDLELGNTESVKDLSDELLIQLHDEYNRKCKVVKRGRHSRDFKRSLMIRDALANEMSGSAGE